MQLAPYIDHTALKADTTEAQIRTLCAEAITYGFASVCVKPCWVELCASLLKDTGIKVCAVVGFPLGATDTTTKVHETSRAEANGATEIDMVINIGWLKSRFYDLALQDIQAVRRACKPETVLKVIIETCMLIDEEKVIACQLAVDGGADFVKTSTGFGKGGATVEDVKLMRATVGSEIGVKASGGIRDRETALAMIEAGANRLGCSASVAIVTS